MKEERCAWNDKMRSGNVLPKPLPPPSGALLALVLILPCLWGGGGGGVLASCPSVCSCSPDHREVDCSWRGLRQLPDGLQRDLRSLNLSHNRLHALDGQLSAHAHLRVLDLSHNWLVRLPAGLPRSLWRLHASANHIRLLGKNDTAYQWNLRVLELSGNQLERAVFINNTLTKLLMLDLSHNRFWTVPTNMPASLETLDLSHNSLVQVLPGSMDRLPQLTHLRLHANRFSALPRGAFDGLAGLRVVTMGDNPWACHLHGDIAYLLSWLARTPARVLGCPCHAQPTCGGAGSSGAGGRHLAPHTRPPLAARAQELSSVAPEASTSNWWSLSAGQWKTNEAPNTPSPLSTSATELATGQPSVPSQSARSRLTTAGETMLTTGSAQTDAPGTTDVAWATVRFFITESVFTSTSRKTSTLRTRSVRRPNQSVPDGVHNTGISITRECSVCLILNLWFLSVILQQVL